MSKWIDRLLPHGTPRRQAASRVINTVKGRQVPTPGISYADWIRDVEPQTLAPIQENGPLISIVVPCYNTPDRYLEPMVESVINQTYRFWELVLVQGSPDPARAQAIREIAKRHKRITLVEAKGNKTIVSNTNEGLAAAHGDFIAFMDHDDTLAPWALNEVAAAFIADQKIEVIYSDEDKLSDDGLYRSLPLFKPDYSPALITTVNYFSHLSAVRRGIIDKVGGLRDAFDGAQDYDFTLRALTLNPHVRHIPKILYHWRQAAGSTAVHPDQKQYVEQAGMWALRDYAIAKKIKADVVTVEGMPTNYRYKYQLDQEPKVYVVPTNKSADFDLNIRPLTIYNNFEVAPGPLELKFLPEDTLILWLDPTLNPENKDWLKELVSQAAQPGQGLVGGWVRTPDTKTLENVYVLENGAAKPMFSGALPDTWYHNGHAIWSRNALMVSPRCAIARAGHIAKFHEHTNLSREDLLRLGLSMHDAGLLNTFWPYARLRDDYGKPAPAVQLGDMRPDPYFSPNLTLMSGGIALKAQAPGRAG